LGLGSNNYRDPPIDEGGTGNRNRWGGTWGAHAASRTLLGHRSLGITDPYAELDQALAIEAARKLG